MRRLLGHHRKKPIALAVLPHLLDAEGVPCTTHEQIAARWRQHFGDLESGSDATPSDIVRACRRPPTHQWPLPECLLELPNEGVLSRVIAASPLHKAPGLDGIPAAVGRSDPAAMAEAVWPLVLKVCLLGNEAAGLKGGALIHLYKGKGPHGQCKSHRGIMLVSVVAKYIHQTLRRLTAPPLQLGGRPELPVTFASHIVRGYLRWKKREGRTACVVFSDIAAAFYAAVRQLAVPVQLNSVDEISSGLGISDRDLAELARLVQQPCALAADEASAWLHKIAATLYIGTWMQVLGTQPDPMVTKRARGPALLGPMSPLPRS